MSSVVVDELRSKENSRLTAIRIAMLTLRSMENWRRTVKDYDSVMILVAVVAITAERLTRAGLTQDERSLTEAIPPERLAPCNLSSIAAATGLNRESVRRRVGALIESGYLVKSAEGAISFRPGHLQQDYIAQMVRDQLDAFVRLANDLCRDGTLVSLSSRP